MDHRCLRKQLKVENRTIFSRILVTLIEAPRCVTGSKDYVNYNIDLTRLIEPFKMMFCCNQKSTHTDLRARTIYGHFNGIVQL